MTDITASSEAEVIDAVRGARDWKSPLNIVGGRSKRGYGRAVASWGTVLDLSGLAGIVAYEPDEMILTVKPGTKVTQIAALLAEHNQCLGFDPPDWGPLFGAPPGCGTIGGAIAADVAGARAVRYGRVRDHLLGFRAVNGLGEAYKAGGKVVKNVTGFDLPKLMCGSFGTLGPLTEVTLRVFPKAVRSVTLVAALDAEEGLSLLRRIWSSPVEAVGLAYRPGEGALIRLEGAVDALAEKIAWLRDSASAREVADDVWNSLDAQFLSASRDIWRIVLPPANAARLIDEIAPELWYADWAGGAVWIGTNDTNLRDVAVRSGGQAVLVRASDERKARVPVFAPETPERAALTRVVKAAFDPLGLFNLGRMWDGV
ncbi:MAG TPA: FAD-binding protein [Rhizomicrobium sp.]|jgi:glycolate oxidase FAD binding subunit